MSEKILQNPLFNLPQISSKLYKQTITQLAQLIQGLDLYTNNLQTKIDGLLQNQQKLFIRAYTDHMNRIRQQFSKMQLQLKQHQQKIAYYENEGRLSVLLKKNNKLEAENKKLYGKLNEKQKIIKNLQIQVIIQKKQIERLTDKVKEYIKQKAAKSELIYQVQSLKYNGTIFTTEISPSKSRQKLSKMNTEDITLHLRSQQRSQILKNDNYETSRLQKQVKKLKKQNKQLLTFNSKFLQNSNEMQNFFFEVVNDIRRSIAVRKKIKQSSLDDFRKEDKLQLLVKVLSNDKILVHLHQAIFSKNNIDDYIEKKRGNSIHLVTNTPLPVIGK